MLVLLFFAAERLLSRFARVRLPALLQKLPQYLVGFLFRLPAAPRQMTACSFAIRCAASCGLDARKISSPRSHKAVAINIGSNHGRIGLSLWRSKFLLRNGASYRRFVSSMTAHGSGPSA